MSFSCASLDEDVEGRGGLGEEARGGGDLLRTIGDIGRDEAVRGGLGGTVVGDEGTTGWAGGALGTGAEALSVGEPNELSRFSDGPESKPENASSNTGFSAAGVDTSTARPLVAAESRDPG